MGSEPQTDAPDLRGKVILVTGGTSGLGARSVVQLAQQNPAHIYFTGRNAKGAEAVIRETAATGSVTTLHFIQCDLASLDSVKAAADTILAEQSRLDVLLANAGIMNHPTSLTEDGYEMQFGVNYLSHALLIRKLLPLMERTAAQPASDVRIVVVTSTGFRGAPSGGIQFDRVKTVQEFPMLGGMIRYGQSKLGDVLLASELARRHPNITSVSVTPGIVNTDLVKTMGPVHRGMAWLSATLAQGGFMTPEDGAKSLLWCVTAPTGQIKSGGFYEPIGELSKSTTKYSRDTNLAKRLWTWTDAELQSWV